MIGAVGALNLKRVYKPPEVFADGKPLGIGQAFKFRLLLRSEIDGYNSLFFGSVYGFPPGALAAAAPAL